MTNFSQSVCATAALPSVVRWRRRPGPHVMARHGALPTTSPAAARTHLNAGEGQQRLSESRRQALGRPASRTGDRLPATTSPEPAVPIAMVGSSLARLAAQAAGGSVGAGGWSFAQIAERLSPAVSKFNVSRAARSARAGTRRRRRRHRCCRPLAAGADRPAHPALPAVPCHPAGRGGRPRRGLLRVDHRRAALPGLCLRHRRAVHRALPPARHGRGAAAGGTGTCRRGRRGSLAACPLSAAALHAAPHLEAAACRGLQIIMAQQNLLPGSRPMVDLLQVGAGGYAAGSWVQQVRGRQPVPQPHAARRRRPLATHPCRPPRPTDQTHTTLLQRLEGVMPSNLTSHFFCNSGSGGWVGGCW